MSKQDFMRVEEHFDLLCEGLTPAESKLYNSFSVVRIETAHVERHFIIYEMGRNGPVEIDRLLFLDFDCTDEVGATAHVSSKNQRKTIVLGYTPVQMFGHGVFMWLPLHSKVRWAASRSNPTQGSLGFPVAIRTKSRYSLTEREVTHCETGPAFVAQFGHSTGI